MQTCVYDEIWDTHTMYGATSRLNEHEKWERDSKTTYKTWVVFLNLLGLVLPIRYPDAQESFHEVNKVGILGPLVPGDLLLDQDTGFLDEPGINLHFLRVGCDPKVLVQQFQPSAVGVG